MENLVKRLQTEAGLTEDQAVKAIAVMKDFMDKEGLTIDWNNFFKGKYSDFKDQTKSFVAYMSNKVSGKVEDMSTQAKRAARDFSKKVYDELNDELKNEEEAG